MELIRRGQPGRISEVQYGPSPVPVLTGDDGDETLEQPGPAALPILQGDEEEGTMGAPRFNAGRKTGRPQERRMQEQEPGEDEDELVFADEPGDEAEPEPDRDQQADQGEPDELPAVPEPPEEEPEKPGPSLADIEPTDMPSDDEQEKDTLTIVIDPGPFDPHDLAASLGSACGREPIIVTPTQVVFPALSQKDQDDFIGDMKFRGLKAQGGKRDEPDHPTVR